jgi:hypothetical protein
MRLRINMDVAALMNFVALKRTKPVNPKTCCAAGGKQRPQPSTNFCSTIYLDDAILT